MSSIQGINELSGHLVLFSLPLWGHTRALCAFAALAVRERSDISITLMNCGGFHPRVQGEVNRYMPENEADFQARLRVVQIGGEKELDPFKILGTLQLNKVFPEYYEKLVRCEPVQCQYTGTTFLALRSPTLVILDYYLPPSLLEAIRARTGTSVPILAWAAGNVFMTLRLSGPDKLGGLGDVPAKVRIVAEETGRDEEEVMDELAHPAKGELVTIPGLPPLYDYEWFPQERDPKIKNTGPHNAAFQFSRTCDGFVCMSSGVYERESVDAFRKWLAETGSHRPLYTLGPLVPLGVGNASDGVSSGAKSFELAMSENGSEFQEFMDKIMKTHGTKSLTYVAFGSLWWPKNENVLLYIDVFLELGMPFIISGVSPNAHIPPEVAQKVKASGIGIISKWTPQQTIFNHSVTGWVVSHCGQNTVIEALAEGLPIIAWPVNADQPANAAHLTLNLDVAFELIEVRSGVAGLKPMYRGTQAKGTPEAVVAEAKKVLLMTKGVEGARKRKNAEAIRDKLRMAWEEGGEGLENLRQLLHLASLAPKKD